MLAIAVSDEAGYDDPLLAAGKWFYRSGPSLWFLLGVWTRAAFGISLFAMPDMRDAATLLQDLPTEFRRAFEAEVNFRRWRAGHPNDIVGLVNRYAAWVEAGEPFARSYRRLVSQYPEAIGRLSELLLPIQRQLLGSE